MKLQASGVGSKLASLLRPSAAIHGHSDGVRVATATGEGHVGALLYYIIIHYKGPGPGPGLGVLVPSGSQDEQGT
jgi:hypothetical protein